MRRRDIKSIIFSAEAKEKVCCLLDSVDAFCQDDQESDLTKIWVEISPQGILTVNIKVTFSLESGAILFLDIPAQQWAFRK